MDASRIASFLAAAKSHDDSPTTVWIRLKLKVKKHKQRGEPSSDECRGEFYRQAKLYETAWKEAHARDGLIYRRCSKKSQTRLGDNSFFERIERKYRLSRAAYLRMLQEQGSKCKCCGKDLVIFSSERSRCPVVDHCHVTGKVRGLLCTRCNVLAGRIDKQDSSVLDAAKAYLAAHKAGA